MDTTTAIIADAHLPFEEKRAYNLMLMMLDCMKPRPSHLILAGDWADCFNVMAHRKHPDIKLFFEDEVFHIRKRLAELRRGFPKAKITWIYGNHEDRFFRYIAEKVPEFYRLVTLESVINVPHLNIEIVPYGPDQAYQIPNTDLFVKHDTPTNIKTALLKASNSLISGHVHQIQETHARSLDGRDLATYSLPCLCDLKSGVFDYVKGHHQWQFGFGLVTHLDNGPWFFKTMQFKNCNGKWVCIHDGVKYEN